MQNPIIIKWNDLLIKETFHSIVWNDYNKPQDNDIVEISKDNRDYFKFNIISNVSKERQQQFKMYPHLKSDILVADDTQDFCNSFTKCFTNWPELINLLKLSTQELLIEISKEHNES